MRRIVLSVLCLGLLLACACSLGGCSAPDPRTQQIEALLQDGSLTDPQRLAALAPLLKGAINEKVSKTDVFVMLISDADGGAMKAGVTWFNDYVKAQIETKPDLTEPGAFVRVLLEKLSPEGGLSAEERDTCALLYLCAIRRFPEPERRDPYRDAQGGLSADEIAGARGFAERLASIRRAFDGLNEAYFPQVLREFTPIDPIGMLRYDVLHPEDYDLTWGLSRFITSRNAAMSFPALELLAYEPLFSDAEKPLLYDFITAYEPEPLVVVDGYIRSAADAASLLAALRAKKDASWADYEALSVPDVIAARAADYVRFMKAERFSDYCRLLSDGLRHECVSFASASADALLRLASGALVDGSYMISVNPTDDYSRAPRGLSDAPGLIYSNVRDLIGCIDSANRDGSALYLPPELARYLFFVEYRYKSLGARYEGATYDVHGISGRVTLYDRKRGVELASAEFSHQKMPNNRISGNALYSASFPTAGEAMTEAQRAVFSLP